MAKRRYSIDESKITRLIKKGRGQGELANYRPWLVIQDLSSRGLSSRQPGRITNRLHHLFSEGELGLFLMLDWSDRVVDIREQYPLDREETRRIAREMGISHPADTKTRCDIVMTTDFLIDLRNDRGGITQHARSFKLTKELDKPRALEKQELERRYWSERDIEWGLVTELDLEETRIRNLRFLHDMLSLKGQIEPREGYWAELGEVLLAALQGSSGISIRALCNKLEAGTRFHKGDALKVLRHLAANKRIRFDLRKTFKVRHPVEFLQVPDAVCQTLSAGVAS